MDNGILARPFWLYATLALLVLQLALFWLSLDAMMEISFICTGSQSRLYSTIGYVHVLYVALFGWGLLSVFNPWARPLYAASLCLGLLALPLQAWLVAGGQLFCDGL